VTLSIATIIVKLPQSNWYIRREELKKRSRSQRRSRHKTKFSSTQFGSGTIHPTPTRFPSTMDTLSTGTPAYMALYPTQSTDGGTWDTRAHTYVYRRGRGVSSLGDRIPTRHYTPVYLLLQHHGWRGSNVITSPLPELVPLNRSHCRSARLFFTHTALPIAATQFELVDQF
jgi:hypothetical protein